MYNVNEFDHLYRRKLRTTSDGSAVVRLETSPLDSKRFRTLTHVTVEDEDNAYTKLRIGVSNRGEKYYLEELDTPSAAELAATGKDINLGDGDRFFAELTGTTSGDTLVVVLVGWDRMK